MDTENAQGEFYLTDLIGIANNQKQDIVIVQVDEDSIKGINSMSQLNEVEDIMQKKLIEGFMEQGVYFQDPTSTYIDADVTISPGTKVFANTHLTGKTTIDENCTIGPNAQINDSRIGKNSKVVNSVVDQSTIHENGNIGPFAHIRPGSELGEGVKVGSFAETKKSKIGKGSKVPHLAYVGDAELGENVNFSAGAITVNYDGKEMMQVIVGILYLSFHVKKQRIYTDVFGMRSKKRFGMHKKEISFPSVGGWSNPIEPLFEVKSNKFPSKSFVDFQHDVTAEDVRLAHREGFISVEHLKRYTTLGMANDQGKMGNII